MVTLTRSELAPASADAVLSFRNKTLSADKTLATVELWLNAGDTAVVSAQLYGLRFDAGLGALNAIALQTSKPAGWTLVQTDASGGSLELAAYANGPQSALAGEAKLCTLSFDVSQASTATGFLVGFDANSGQYELGYAGQSTRLTKAVPGPINCMGYDMSGTARFWAGTKPALHSVELTLHDSASSRSVNTAPSGEFALSGFDSSRPGLEARKSVAADAAVAVKAAIGLSDVLDALKLYLNKPVANPSPYKYIAADMDASGVLDLKDVLGILKFYLGKSPELGPTWAFVDPSHMTANAAGFTPSHCAAAPVVVDLEQQSSLELVGVLRGDVNGSWAPTTA